MMKGFHFSICDRKKEQGEDHKQVLGYQAQRYRRNLRAKELGLFRNPPKATSDRFLGVQENQTWLHP